MQEKGREKKTVTVNRLGCTTKEQPLILLLGFVEQTPP